MGNREKHDTHYPEPINENTPVLFKCAECDYEALSKELMQAHLSYEHEYNTKDSAYYARAWHEEACEEAEKNDLASREDYANYREERD